jgi:trigger factor
LEFKLHEVNTSEQEVEVTYSYDEIKGDIDKEIKQKIKKIQVPGFRKGKAPLNFIKKMYGDALEFEASEKVANNKFWDIVKEKNLNPINTPVITDLKFEPQSDLFFKIKYEIMPAIDAKDYKGFEIELPKTEVRDEDVEYEIKNIRNSHRTLEDAEEVGENKEEVITVDVVRLDDNNNEIEGTVSEKIDIDLSNEKVQPEIVENSKGKKKGESFTFSFTDERVVKNLEGVEDKITETFSYKAEIKEIKKIKLPELDEEFLKKTFGDKVTSEQELRDEIRRNIESYFEKQIEDLHRNKIVEKIIQNNPFEPPHSMVHRYMDQIMKMEEDKAKEQKRPFNRAEMGKRMHGVAEYELKWHMLKENIKEKENIIVTDEELNEIAQKEAEKTGITVDKLINYYNSSGYKNNLSDRKLFDFLKSNNSVKYTEPNRRDVE